MKILVLAGGYDQKDLILELKKRQHHVILADYFTNPPAKTSADAFYQISTLDVAAVRDLAQREGVERVTTACTDQALLTAAQVSDDLGLPCYLSFDTARNVTNKAYMKEVFSRHGIPTAPYRICSDPLDEVRDLPYPRVVKPVDSNSSKGVQKVIAPEGMPGALAEAIRESRTRTALVESFLPGEEISVDAYIEDSQAKVLMISETVKVPHTDGFTIVQSRVPAEISPAAAHPVEKICQKIAQAFGLQETPLLVQCVVSPEGVHVLEFSARMGGGTKHRLIEAVTGVDMIRVFADLLEEKRPQVAPVHRETVASLTYCYGHPGVFFRLEHHDDLQARGIIDDCFPYKTAGMAVQHAWTSSDRICGYLISGETMAAVTEKEAEAGRTLKMIGENQRDLFRRDLLPVRVLE